VKDVGFYFRKSINFGGLRFNLSKSGIGMSVGVKGFRIGTGPRGNYVHMGRNGLYYRAALGSKGKTAKRTKSQPETPVESIGSQPKTLVEQTQSNLEFVDIESADVAQITDSSSEELLKEIADKNRKRYFWPFCFLLSFIVPPIGIFIAIIAAFLVYNLMDKKRKTVVLLYDIDEYTEEKLQEFYNSFDEIINAKAKWHISSEAETKDYKYHAGAGKIVKRTPITVKYTTPKYMKTNVKIPCIPVGKQLLYFFPDKVLIYEGKRVGAVSYNNLQISQRNQHFVVRGTVPSDAVIVDYTWQYLNKSGGPDKRFSNNPRLPIAFYSEINFTSETGLNERIQVSKPDVGKNLILQLSKLVENVNFEANDTGSSQEIAIDSEHI